MWATNERRLKCERQPDGFCACAAEFCWVLRCYSSSKYSSVFRHCFCIPSSKTKVVKLRQPPSIRWPMPSRILHTVRNIRASVHQPWPTRPTAIGQSGRSAEIAQRGTRRKVWFCSTSFRRRSHFWDKSYVAPYCKPNGSRRLKGLVHFVRGVKAVARAFLAGGASAQMNFFFNPNNYFLRIRH